MSRIPLILLALAIACSDDDAPTDTDGGAGRDAAMDGGRAGASGRAGSGAAGRAGSAGTRPGDAGPDAGGPRPTAFMLEGDTTGFAEEDLDAGTNRRITCGFSVRIEMLEFEANGDFEGQITFGELFRAVETNGMGSEFRPIIGGEASLRHTSGDDVELRFVGDQPANALPFWQELEVVTGMETGEHRYGGEFQCAPGLLNEPGFMDVDVTITGEWTMRPE